MATQLPVQGKDDNLSPAFNDIQAVKDELHLRREQQAIADRRRDTERKFVLSCCLAECVAADDLGWQAWEDHFFAFAALAQETGRGARLDLAIEKLTNSSEPIKRVVGGLLLAAKNQGPIGHISRTLRESFGVPGEGFLHSIRDELRQALQPLRANSEEQRIHLNNVFVAAGKIALATSRWLAGANIPQDHAAANQFLHSVENDIFIFSDALRALAFDVGDLTAWHPSVIEPMLSARNLLKRLADVPEVPAQISPVERRLADGIAAVLGKDNPSDLTPDLVGQARMICGSCKEFLTVGTAGHEALSALMNGGPDNSRSESVSPIAESPGRSLADLRVLIDDAATNIEDAEPMFLRQWLPEIKNGLNSATINGLAIQHRIRESGGPLIEDDGKTAVLHRAEGGSISWLLGGAAGFDLPPKGNVVKALRRWCQRIDEIAGDTVPTAAVWEPVIPVTPAAISEMSIPDRATAKEAWVALNVLYQAILAWDEWLADAHRKFSHHPIDGFRGDSIVRRGRTAFVALEKLGFELFTPMADGTGIADDWPQMDLTDPITLDRYADPANYGRESKLAMKRFRLRWATITNVQEMLDEVGQHPGITLGKVRPITTGRGLDVPAATTGSRAELPTPEQSAAAESTPLELSQAMRGAAAEPEFPPDDGWHFEPGAEELCDKNGGAAPEPLPDEAEAQKPSEEPQFPPNGTRLRKPRLPVNAKMLETLQKKPEAAGWTVEQWRVFIGCTKSTIHGTETWRRLRATHVVKKLDMRSDKYRSGKKPK